MLRQSSKHVSRVRVFCRRLQKQKKVSNASVSPMMFSVLAIHERRYM